MYRLQHGYEGAELRPAFKTQLRSAFKALRTPDGFREYLGRCPLAQWDDPQQCGPLELFVGGHFSRGYVTINPTSRTVQVQDMRMRSGPVVELEIPGWARQFIDRWFDVCAEFFTTEFSPYHDECGHIPSEGAARILEEVL